MISEKYADIIVLGDGKIAHRIHMNFAEKIYTYRFICISFEIELRISIYIVFFKFNYLRVFI